MLSFGIIFCALLRLALAVFEENGDTSQNCHIDSRKCCAKTFSENVRLPAFEKTRFDLRSNAIEDSQDVSWITDIPNLPILFATSPTLPNGRCRDQVRRYRRDLSESILWASEMFDASTKYPSGFIYGHTKHLGNFDQCYELSAKLSPRDARSEDEEQVEGRYCLVRVKYRRKNITSTDWKPYTLDFDPNSSVWEALEDRRDFRRGKRDSILSALCVPATCGAEDVELALKDSLKKWGDAHDVDLSMSIDPMHCQARKDSPQPLSTNSKIFCLILLVLLTLVIGSSWYDNNSYSPEQARENYGSEKVLLSFSLRRNLRAISQGSTSSRELDCIHLIRVIFMIYAVLCHGFFRIADNPVMNLKQAERLYENQILASLSNLPIVNNGFLAVAGIILAYTSLENIDRGKNRSLIVIGLTRMWRLMPLYMLAVYVHGFLLPQLGSGPFWRLRVETDERNCRQMSWTNFLYVNNYVEPEKICMYQSWYLAVDFQLYIMGSIVLRVFQKLPRCLGYIFLVSVLGVGLVVSSLLTYAKGVHPFWLAMPSHTDPRQNTYFTTYQVKTDLYIGSYMVGILSGVIMYNHRASMWKLSKIWSGVLFFLLIPGLAFGSMALGRKYTDPNYDYKLHLVETALFATLHRVFFALGICCIPLILRFGSGLDVVRRVLTPWWASPVAGLSYGVSLLHTLHQIYDAGITRSPRIFSVHDMIRDTVVDVIIAFGLSLIVAVIFEHPLRRLGRLIYTRNSRREATSRIPLAGSKKVI